MAINFMDNFSIYGTDGAYTNIGRTLNGVYAESAYMALVVDPDGVSPGRVLQAQNTNYSKQRKVLPNARATVGVALRLWLSNLPGAGGVAYISQFLDVGANLHITIGVDTSGYIRAYRQDAAGAVLLGTSANPVVVANAWQHIESKVLIDAAAGTVEVRVEGVTVLNLAAIRTASNNAGVVATVQNIILAGGNGNFGATTHFKDFLVWDSTGAFNNNFMGSCQIYGIVPDGDVALNWTPSPADGVGWNKLNEVTPDDDGKYISAAYPGIPAAYKASLTDLPVTVTSVRGVMPIHRSRKTDGGDGNVQLGLISGASTGLGADRPISTAYTYWWDVYDADPNGGIAWTRLAVNALTLQINRTV